MLAAFAAFVAYLSFVPFRYQPLAFDDALARFARIPYLDLGAGSRADWVANILMFLPLGWLAAALFVPRPRGRFDLAAIAPSLALGAAWAVAVEFGQLYFPNRTVSINDIVAEVIGTFLGAWLWCAFGASSRDWWRTLLRGGRASASAALGAYLLAYLVMSFSPFDVVISIDELAHKAASDLNGWWLAPIGCGRTPCGLKLLAEALAVAPFGWWLAMRRGGQGRSLGVAAVAGASLGVLIELGQFLLVSGTSQGASVVSRAAGAAAGAWLHSLRGRIVGIDWVRWGRPLVLAGALPWLAAVAYIAGWPGGRWLAPEAALARFGEVEWLPFYYQYYSTEQALIRSTLVHLVLYLPVGVAVWLWGRRTNSSSGAAAALLAGAIAIVAETGKLFVEGRHPDYTDVLFAMAAAWAAATVLRWASSVPVAAPVARPARAFTSAASSLPPVARQASTAADPATDTHAAPRADDAVEAVGLAGSWGARLGSATLLVVVAISLLRFPVGQLSLAVALLAYAALLLRWPLAYLLVVPVALPLLDLAGYSGRFFWDEFDLLLATTLGVRLLTAAPRRAAPQPPKLALSLLALSVAASTAVALWPPAPLDANSFTSYLSPYNALRVAKGYVWGGALLWLLWRDAATGREVALRLQLGLGLALLAAALGVFWERLVFVGLANFGAWFRAAGMVSATHVGGAYLEAMLVVQTPFALPLAASALRFAAAALWLAVALLGAAAVLMTLSRAAAVAWAIVVATFALLWWFRAHRLAGQHWRIAGAAGAVALLGAGALMAQSSYLRDRLTLTGTDFGVRLAHWRTTADLMRGNPLHVVFGMGLGSFPREYYLAHAATARIAAYRLGREPGDGRAYLSLLGGRGMYLDQRVEADRGEDLLLRGQVRSSPPGAELAVALCEKSFLASVGCDWAVVPAAAGWRPFEVRLRLPAAASRRIGPAAPVSLSLHNGGFGTRIDVTGLSLAGGSEERLANGSFGHGLDRWLMHSDAHLAWRAHSTWLQIAFEQGLLGFAAWLAVGLGVVFAAARRLDAHFQLAALAAAAGFVVVGSFDTLLDAPRITLLVALLFSLATRPIARTAAGLSRPDGGPLVSYGSAGRRTAPPSADRPLAAVDGHS